MREQTVELRASSLSDGIGICWFLHDLDGLRAIGHGGSGNGQDGDTCNQSVVRWALEHYRGVVEKTAEPLPYDQGRAQEVVGRYDIDALNLDIATDGTRLTLAVGIKPEIHAASQEDMPRTTRSQPSVSFLTVPTSTSSLKAASKVSAATSPATRAAPSPASTSPAGSSTGSRKQPDLSQAGAARSGRPWPPPPPAGPVTGPRRPSWHFEPPSGDSQTQPISTATQGPYVRDGCDSCSPEDRPSIHRTGQAHGAYFSATASPDAVAVLVVPVPAKCQRQVPEAFAVVVVFSLPALSVVTVLTVVYVEAPDFLN